MKHGDFTKLASFYANRPGYSLEVLDIISTYIDKKQNIQEKKVADVGAGTGKLTENLAELGLTGFAVEPNDEMRKYGKAALEGKDFTWYGGPAEEMAFIPDNAVDWVLMGSSFHWTDKPVALKEFHRILKPGGFFTAIWNPRNVSKNELNQRIEEKIKAIVPELKRVSSGSADHLSGLEDDLLATPYFSNLLFVEGPHIEEMSHERYMGAWKSVNDIQVQAGPERFQQILDMIEKEIEPYPTVCVPYKSRAWTVRSTKTR